MKCGWCAGRLAGGRRLVVVGVRVVAGVGCLWLVTSGVVVGHTTTTVVVTAAGVVNRCMRRVDLLDLLLLSRDDLHVTFYLFPCRHRPVDDWHPTHLSMELALVNARHLQVPSTFP
jgi:hypothetical protein